MKKVIISILSLAMTVSMAVPAFADTTADVQGKYKAGAESPVTISADITWEDMTFDYTEGEKTWNTETHRSIRQTANGPAIQRLSQLQITLMWALWRSLILLPRVILRAVSLKTAPQLTNLSLTL